MRLVEIKSEIANRIGKHLQNVVEAALSFRAATVTERSSQGLQHLP